MTPAPNSDPDSPRRFLGVFFTDWLIDLESALLRRAVARHEGASAWVQHPLVVLDGRGRADSVACHAIVACNDAAVREGLRVGMTVSQAESICPQQRDADAVAWRSCIERLRIAAQDSCARSVVKRIVAVSERFVAIERDGAMAARMLVRLGRCLERWIPVVSVPPELQPLLARAPARRNLTEAGSAAGDVGQVPSADWLVGDFTGCAALFRGVHASEQGLMRRIEACFRRRGFRVHMATASTIGAATALARFGGTSPVLETPCTRSRLLPSSRKRCIAVPKGSEAKFLADLPIESLRIASSSADSLHAVEVHTVGQLAALGRAGIAARLTGLQSADASMQSAGATTMRRPRKASRRSRHVASTPAWPETPTLFAPASGGAFEATATGREAFYGVSDGSQRTRACSAHCLPATGRLRAADDVLLRLDQAMGVVPEILVPLRLHEPIVLEHIFEAPCSRPDVISMACSELVEQLMIRLSRRREGLRSATWSFTHADLPADLSTDALPDIHRSADQCTDPFSRHREIVSSIELGLAKPASRASHVWSVLRARLEQIALDHGVERIECRVDRATLLRFRQARLCGPAVQARVARPFADREQASDCRAALTEWIELVSARIGPASVIRPNDLVHASELVPSQVCPRTHRPSAVLPCIERAVLRAGDTSRGIARSIATRTLWRAAPPDIADGSPRECPDGSSFARPAQLEWRDDCWSISAIDGWERSLSSWWDPSAGNASAQARTHPTGVLSRLAIATSDGWLWLLVRWPERLPVPRAMPDGASPSHPVSHRLHDASPYERTDRWFSGSSRSLEQGIELEVLGLWS